MVKVRIELHHLYDAEFVLNSLRFVMRLVNVFFKYRLAIAIRTLLNTCTLGFHKEVYRTVPF